MESRRVHDENRLLRRLLHTQGLDDAAIERAIITLRAHESETMSPALHRPPTHASETTDGCLNYPHSRTQVSPLAPILTGSEMPSDVQTDAYYQELNIDDWLTDLCNIKDAFASDANVRIFFDNLSL